MMMKEKVDQYAEQVQNDPKGNRKRVLREFSEMLDRQVCSDQCEGYTTSTVSHLQILVNVSIVSCSVH